MLSNIHIKKLAILTIVPILTFAITACGQPTAKDYVQFDDMLFKTNVIGTKSAFSATRWTNGIVYYEFDSNVSASNKLIWLDAAQQWANVSDLHFVERTTQSNYIHVQDDDGNWSYVGMIGGKQEMGIYNWNYKFIVAHEIGHAVGLMHEHSRPDRDDYVTILFENIIEDRESNFEIRSADIYGQYDFYSVMHYDNKAFSSNGLNTIEPLPAYSSMLNVMGQRTYLSDLDKSGMNDRYPNLVIGNISVTPKNSSTTPPTVSGTVTVSATIIDNDTITAELFVDDILVGPMTNISGDTFSLQWNTIYSTGGTKTIKIIATDDNGNTSSSTYQVIVDAPNPDIDNDGKVDLNDFSLLASSWLKSNCRRQNQYCNGIDIDESGKVDLPDMEIIAANWMYGTY
ncbi:MAG: hypothetical protein JEZ07_12180 [Phycisphaerae bacterium]|nr:hypothetical protein [Phycisphaerae bacterium]